MITRTDNVAGTTTAYYYAGQQMLESQQYLPSPAGGGVGGEGSFVNGSTCTTQQFVWSPRYVDAPVQSETMVSTYSTAGGGSWTAGTPTDVYYLTDANNNVTAVTDSSGNVLERYIYDAYGHVTIYNATWSATSSTSAVGNALYFAGMLLDPATGMSDADARWYNSSTGSFLSRDPAQSSPNLYCYCGNDPTGEVDPSGMMYTFAAAVAWTLMGGNPMAPATPSPVQSFAAAGPGKYGSCANGLLLYRK